MTQRSIPELLEVVDKTIARRKRMGITSGHEEPSDLLLETVAVLLRVEHARTPTGKGKRP
jgi:hypothetical protein